MQMERENLMQIKVKTNETKLLYLIPSTKPASRFVIFDSNPPL